MTNTPDVQKNYWHVARNDEIGGWSVTNFNVAVTSQLQPDLGHRVVADVLSEEVAREIADTHNRNVDDRLMFGLDQWFDHVLVQVKVGDIRVAHKELMNPGSPVDMHEHILREVVAGISNKLRELLARITRR